MNESEPASTVPVPSSDAPADAPPILIAITRGELLWISVGLWLGGIFILTLLPMLLFPWLGGPMGVAISYLAFFIAWQPAQMITQRTLGVRSAGIRMVLFVGTAAILAFYFREALLAFRP